MAGERPIPARELLRTNAVPTRDLRRCILGFRLKAKSEHEAAQVSGWYGVGTGMVGRVYAWGGAIINGERREGEINDAARRVATSSGERENRF